MSRALTRLMAETWAIQPSALQDIISVATGENKSVEAVAKELGRELNNTYDVEYRNGVASIPVTGPLVMKGNLFSKVSGLTSYNIIAQDFNVALNDDTVKAIIFTIHSPGGMVDGVSELADMIYLARGIKPIVAYVEGMAASAAYWIAAATDRIYLPDTAQAGNLGAVMTVGKNDDDVIEIVSEQTPYKRIDAESKEGKALLKGHVNYAASIFISKVALYRGVSESYVLENYGKGDMLIGENAVNAGLADEVSTYEHLMSSLQDNDASVAGMSATKETKEVIMADKKTASADDDGVVITAEAIKPVTVESIKANNPEVLASITTEANSRVEDILTSEHATGREVMAKHLAFKTNMDVKAATSLLETAPKQTESSFDAAMLEEGNIDVGAGSDVTLENDGWDAAFAKVGK